MTATSASVRFRSDGVAEVESFVRLTGHSFIHCCTYDDIAPILAIKDGHVDISVTVPAQDQVTADDLAMARLLAQAVTEYVAELEKLAAQTRAAATADADSAGQAA